MYVQQWLLGLSPKMIIFDLILRAVHDRSLAQQLLREPATKQRTRVTKATARRLGIRLWIYSLENLFLSRFSPLSLSSPVYFVPRAETSMAQEASDPTQTVKGVEHAHKQE